MKLIKFITLFSLCITLLLLTGCAWFRGETAQHPIEQQNPVISQPEDFLPGIPDDSGDIVMDLGSSAEVLPSRPQKEWQPVQNQKITVYFAFDQSTIGTAQIPQLEAVADYLKAHNDIGMLIEGHCDERGSHEYNIGLGEKRALAVRNYLVSLGVPDNHIQTISYGSERPALSGHTELDYSKNRRADLIPAKM